MENDPWYRKGFEEGRLKGARKIAIEVAALMKEDNFPVEQISRCTKLSIEEIERL